MSATVFKPIACGETLPVNNVHAVSVSMPTLQDVVDYEEQTSHHIIIKCFEHLFENLSYNELDKIINFGLIDINMNILSNIHIKNLILEKN